MCSQPPSGTRNLNSDPVTAAVAYFEKYISSANPFYCSESSLDKSGGRAPSLSTFSKINQWNEARVWFLWRCQKWADCTNDIKLKREKCNNLDKTVQGDFFFATSASQFPWQRQQQSFFFLLNCNSARLTLYVYILQHIVVRVTVAAKEAVGHLLSLSVKWNKRDVIYITAPLYQLDVGLEQFPNLLDSVQHSGEKTHSDKRASIYVEQIISTHSSGPLIFSSCSWAHEKHLRASYYASRRAALIFIKNFWWDD